MQSTSKSHSVSSSKEHGEVQFSIAGIWDEDSMAAFLAKLDEASLPMVKARQRIHVLGDMREFTAQTQETADLIRNHLIAAQKFGLEKVAIITGSAIVKLQYRRLSDGINVEFFETKISALSWLRT